MRDGFVKVSAATPKICVADTEYNTAAIVECMKEANRQQVKVLALPELCITGYTCGELFLQDVLLNGAVIGLKDIISASVGMDMLIFAGLPLRIEGCLYNCAAAVYDGTLLGVVPKVNIPNHSEFYEKRYFAAGTMQTMPKNIRLCDQTVPFGAKLLFEHLNLPELKVACEICEDLWVPESPSVSHALAGATVVVNLAASNETVGKTEYRHGLVGMQSAKLICCYLYADAGEGESTQDVVYVGHNLIYENGELLAKNDHVGNMIVSETDVYRLQHDRQRMMSEFGTRIDNYTRIPWGDALVQTGLTRFVAKRPFVNDDAAVRSKRCEEILHLQCLGLKKRIEHVQAKKLVVGISGGLDSTLAMLVSAQTLQMLGRDPKDLLAVTMPCFGTTARTRSNAELLAEKLGAELRVVDITESVRKHFKDIHHDEKNLNVVFENAQARERTQVLMDIANGINGIVIGTGDLSELALGWATYNGDHMSMYGVNAGIPKTLIQHLVIYAAETCGDKALRQVLMNVVETPVSPELLPAENGEISQKTENLVGPYELHDFFLYHIVRWGCTPKKLYRLAKHVFQDEYDDDVILKWMKTFYRRFFGQQFKRSCLPDGPKIGSVALSPRGDWRMPSDASARIWLRELETL